MTQSEAKAHHVEQAGLDVALDDTFPASDPPSQTDPTHGVRVGAPPPTEDAVRERAYQIWQEVGSPEGDHDEHWSRARAELEAEAGGVSGD